MSITETAEATRPAVEIEQDEHATAIIGRIVEHGTQREVAGLYAEAILAAAAKLASPDWPTINAAIVTRWSMSGLERIKKMAFYNFKQSKRAEKMADQANDHAAAAQALFAKVAPLMADHPPGVQGAALADLLALYLAGHVVTDDPAATASLREMILDLHIGMVRTLIPINEAIMAARLKREGGG